jgi:hypothetical protein
MIIRGQREFKFENEQKTRIPSIYDVSIDYSIGLICNLSPLILCIRRPRKPIKSNEKNEVSGTHPEGQLFVCAIFRNLPLEGKDSREMKYV